MRLGDGVEGILKHCLIGWRQVGEGSKQLPIGPWRLSTVSRVDMRPVNNCQRRISAQWSLAVLVSILPVAIQDSTR